MGKVKYKVNKTVASYGFHKNILENNILYKLCKIFELHDVYIDVYSINNNKSNLCDLLGQCCKNVLFMTSGDRRCQDLHLKVSINDVSCILKILKGFYFEDLNVWDCYTDWKQYLKDMNDYNAFISERSADRDKSTFYLNYKENQAEIICDLTRYPTNLEEALNKIL